MDRKSIAVQLFAVLFAALFFCGLIAVRSACFFAFCIFCVLSSVWFMMVRFFRFFTDCQYKKTLSSLQDERVRGTT